MKAVLKRRFAGWARRVVPAGLAMFFCLTTAAWGGLFSDFDSDYEEEHKEWNEGEYQTPAFPKKTNLRQFFINGASSNRFMLDESSLDVGKDGVVRYVLVIAAPGGAETVTFEGLRCDSGEYRIYAIAQPDGNWASPRRSDWQLIANIQPRASLLADYFCDGPSAPYSRQALLRQMKKWDRGEP